MSAAHTPAPVLAPLGEAFAGPAIVTRYLGSSGRIVATHKRAPGETERVALPYQPGWDAERNHRAAAEALAAAMGHGPRVLVARGHDADQYVWVSVGLRQVEPAALALAACRELVAACAAGATAEALALPLALARQALRIDSDYRPTIAGFAELSRPSRLEIRDILEQPVLTLPGTLSPAGAMAACQAAGWPLTAPMAALAIRWADLGQTPDPAAVALALEARGGCPAAVAALTAKGVA
jgi:hypothetical protein